MTEHFSENIGFGYIHKPYQQPHPPIGVAGVSAKSDTLTLAGERGWIPMSINFLPGSGADSSDSPRATATPGTRDWTNRSSIRSLAHNMSTIFYNWELKFLCFFSGRF